MPTADGSEFVDDVLYSLFRFFISRSNTLNSYDAQTEEKQYHIRTNFFQLLIDDLFSVRPALFRGMIHDSIRIEF